MKQNANPLIDSAIDAALETLTLSDTNVLRTTLREIGTEYCDAREFDSLRGSAKEQKKLIKPLQQQLAKAADLMTCIAPEYLVALDTVSPRRRSVEARPSVAAFHYHLRHLSDDAESFLERFQPIVGPPADVALEAAILSLSPIVEEASGDRVKVKTNEHAGRPPELASGSAKAIGRFLSALNPKLSQTRIVNAIVKMADRKTVSHTHWDRLIELHDPLDLSLLSNRSQE